MLQCIAQRSDMLIAIVTIEITECGGAVFEVAVDELAVDRGGISPFAALETTALEDAALDLGEHEVRPGNVAIMQARVTDQRLGELAIL